MTAHKYLETRATAVYQTWGKDVPGRIAFFTSATSTPPNNFPQLPLVRLHNVDDSYPPQKKSFMMILYMWENFGDQYEWFLRADDDVYIRPDKIESFLRSINSSKPHFIGQAGRGNQEEFGQLSLRNDENFCMGGPGVILSRETLSKVAPHVKYCLQNLMTTHEDVELGRCVRKFANIPCTWSYEMQSIFYHNFGNSSVFLGNLKTKEVNRAITLHPIKHHQHMYRIHNYMQGLIVHDLQQRKISLHRDILFMKELSGWNSFAPRSVGKYTDQAFKSDHNVSGINLAQKSSLLGIPPGLRKYKPRTEDDVFTWDLISHTLYSNNNMNPRRKIDSSLKEGLDDVIRELMDNMNLFSRERGRVIEFQQILYGYHRLNPLYGPDYILDVLLTFKKYRGKKMTVPVRRHAYIQQQFADLEIREAPEKLLSLDYPSILLSQSLPNWPSRDNVFFNPLTSDHFHPKETSINIIVSLYKKQDAFSRFIRTYEEVCLEQDGNTSLYIILFLNEESEIENEAVFQRTLQITKRLEMKFKQAREKIKVIPMKGRFSRAKALENGLENVENNELLFFIDVDMVWTRETLQRVRINTVPGKSVYFPIVFSQFDPSIFFKKDLSPNHFLINEETGYWRIFGYGILSVYKEDIIKVGGFNTSIFGWGREDVDLFEKFLQSPTNVSVLRSVDPTLVHVFHIVDCDSSLDVARLSMCRNTRSETYGSINQLSNIVYKNKESIFQYAKNKQETFNKPIR